MTPEYDFIDVSARQENLAGVRGEPIMSAAELGLVRAQSPNTFLACDAC